MSLFLVQHGENLPKDVDPEKGLSDEGKDEVKRIASLAGEHAIPVSVIKHSGKKRARQTAEILAEALKLGGGVQDMEGLAPLDDVTKLNVRAMAEALGRTVPASKYSFQQARTHDESPKGALFFFGVAMGAWRIGLSIIRQRRAWGGIQHRRPVNKG